MSCLILNGRAEVCYDSIGGIDAIYFVNRGTYVYPTDVDYNATNTDSIDAITGVTQLFKYELNGVNLFDQTQTPSADNGTNFVAQVLTAQLKKQDPTMHKNFKLMAYGRPSVVVKNRNNQFFMMGLEYGAKMTAGSIVNGTQMGDFNGYNFTLTANERIPANFLVCTSEADLAATVFDGATIVEA
jgi:7-cyano-7-deazaguanine synthase in queuosine biosynthesis